MVLREKNPWEGSLGDPISYQWEGVGSWDFGMT